MSKPFTPETILIYVGLDLVGDALLKLPMIRALRQAYPEARITWLAGKRESVFAGLMAPFVEGLLDEVIEYGKVGLSPMELLRPALGGRHFDLIIDTQKVALASLCLWRIPHKRFISSFGKYLLSSAKPPKGKKKARLMMRQLLDLAELATGQTFETPTSVDLPMDRGTEKLAAKLLPKGPVYVGLSVGSGGRPKCWPLANFIALAKEQTKAGRVPVFLIGPQELDWLAEIKAAVPGALFPLQEDTSHGYSPLITIALGKRLACAVSNDSGAGHMLASSGVKLVSLFGPTSAEKFRPCTESLTLIRAQDFGEGGEMGQIPVEAVAEAVSRSVSN